MGVHVNCSLGEDFGSNGVLSRCKASGSDVPIEATPRVGRIQHTTRPSMLKHWPPLEGAIFRRRSPLYPSLAK
eukprot:3599994-Amphidinium_carterae.1